MEPLVCWKGERKQFVPALVSRLPRNFGTYFEPFFGGGSLYSVVAPESAMIGDVNGSLMNVYRQARKNSGLLVAWLCKYQHMYNGFANLEDKEKDYIIRRAKYNQGLHSMMPNMEDAALFIYLNKVGQNHAYHLNDTGDFDVPFGGENQVELFDLENLYAFSELLQGAQIFVGDYEITASKARKNDFLFLDPPELYEGTTDVPDTFSLEEHIHLSKFFAKMDKKGVYCMLVAQDTDPIRNLYRNYRIEELENADAAASEKYLVIRNYS